MDPRRVLLQQYIHRQKFASVHYQEYSNSSRTEITVISTSLLSTLYLCIIHGVLTGGLEVGCNSDSVLEAVGDI